MIRNLIWDVDGTLFDTYPAIVGALLQTLRSFEVIESAEAVLPLAKIGLSHCIRGLASRHGIPEDELGERFRRLYGSTPKTTQMPFAGVEAVCRAAIQAGGINAIVTHRSRASTGELLAAHGMDCLFAEIVAGDDGLPKKPDPTSFLAIIGRRRLDPSETAAIGDRDVDVLAAKAAGLVTCLFAAMPCGVGEDFVFVDYSDLGRYLELPLGHFW